MAQWKSDLYSSENEEALPASTPPIVPSFGAVDGIVKTSGSSVGGFVFDGRYVPRGKRM